VDWMGQTEDRNKVKGSYGCGIEHSGSIKCWEVLGGCTTGGLLNSVQLQLVSVTI
jgi:hypothetical protein